MKTIKIQKKPSFIANNRFQIANNRFNKYFTNIIKKLNLKKDTRASFESQENFKMIK